MIRDHREKDYQQNVHARRQRNAGGVGAFGRCIVENVGEHEQNEYGVAANHDCGHECFHQVVQLESRSQGDQAQNPREYHIFGMQAHVIPQRWFTDDDRRRRYDVVEIIVYEWRIIVGVSPNQMRFVFQRIVRRIGQFFASLVHYFVQ